MRLDRRMKWAKHIKTKRKQVNLKAEQMHCLLGRSTLSIESELLLYKAVLKPIRTYETQLWGDSLQFQHRNPPELSIQDSAIHSERTLVHNHRIREDLEMNTVLSEIEMWNTKYLRKLENHTNALALNLLDNSGTTHRLKRYTVLTLPR
jgi:hypothetical protein